MPDKPPYKLTIALEAFQAEALHRVLARIQELTSEHDQVAELKTKIAIESNDDQALMFVRDSLEAFLRVNAVPVECKVTFESPGVRPRIQPQTTPMDALLDEVPRATPQRKRTDPRTWSDDDYQVRETDDAPRRTSPRGQR